ncbi:hypothetical protein MIND_00150800 [Mycena indigotica]|uniref:Uncharacterized protein n=1 Tax=Mycena indigotica TaxID=2126181 RepID=A0A8H6TF12_9AGAR|nr:uncharacterized protein MIND_00150800 [Mycena indigotica]KAF7316320.1 hypothetical protein MIND_00150800 [Mycena indigotica]
MECNCLIQRLKSSTRRDDALIYTMDNDDFFAQIFGPELVYGNTPNVIPEAFDGPLTDGSASEDERHAIATPVTKGKNKATTSSGITSPILTRSKAGQNKSGTSADVQATPTRSNNHEDEVRPSLKITLKKKAQSSKGVGHTSVDLLGGHVVDTKAESAPEIDIPFAIHAAVPQEVTSSATVQGSGGPIAFGPKLLNTMGVANKLPVPARAVAPSVVIGPPSAPNDTQTKLDVQYIAKHYHEIKTLMEAYQAAANLTSNDLVDDVAIANVGQDQATQYAPVAIDNENQLTQSAHSSISTMSDTVQDRVGQSTLPKAKRSVEAQAVLKRKKSDSDVGDEERFHDLFAASHYFNNASYSSLPMAVSPPQCLLTKEILVFIPVSMHAEFYALPPLSVGRWTPWSDVGEDYDYASLKAVVSPANTNGLMLKTALVFKTFRQFINGSRASPSAVIAVSPAMRSQVTLCATSADQVAVFTSVIKVESSFLRTGYAAGNSAAEKGVSGMMLRGEFERMACLTTMVLHKPEVHVQMRGVTLSFTTNRAASTNSPAKKPRAGPCITTTAPRNTGISSRGGVGRDSLRFEETVPVYDCTTMSVNFQDALDRLESLPRFKKPEIPVNSLAVVGYSCVAYKKQDHSDGLALNIRWIMVISDPLPDPPEN